ncbi:MAG: hypothetical protein K2X91_08680, partial [Thermoleophilia bacterium]|nr:hypothetical protein [Thermoleophilia bacterium]
LAGLPKAVSVHDFMAPFSAKPLQFEDQRRALRPAMDSHKLITKFILRQTHAAGTSRALAIIDEGAAGWRPPGGTTRSDSEVVR